MATETAKGYLVKATDGEFADQDPINANMDKISLYAMGAFNCTSATRPGIPWNGMRIYEEDTRKKAFWDEVNNLWMYDSQHRTSGGGYVQKPVVMTVYEAKTTDASGALLFNLSAYMTVVTGVAFVGVATPPLVATIIAGGVAAYGIKIWNGAVAYASQTFNCAITFIGWN